MSLLFNLNFGGLSSRLSAVFGRLPSSLDLVLAGDFDCEMTTDACRFGRGGWTNLFRGE